MLQAIKYATAGIAVAAFVYSTLYYLKFASEFEIQRRMGAIPAHLMRSRMGIGWMIASAGLVPAGEGHRKRCIAGAAVFGVCMIALMILSGHG